MSKNIEMNIKLSTGSYEVLYPKTTGSQVSGTVSSATTASSCTGNAATATKLATSRTIRTNLASTSTASFDGSGNITPGVTGVLPVANGGTGSSTEKYLPLTGGTLSGNLTLKGSSNYGTAINLGDGDYVHISEPTDDCLEIKAKQVNFVLSNTSSSTQFTINGSSPFQSGNSSLSFSTATYTHSGSTTFSFTTNKYASLFIITLDSTGLGFYSPNDYRVFYNGFLAIAFGSNETQIEQFLFTTKGTVMGNAKWVFKRTSSSFSITNTSSSYITSGSVIKIWYV